ncbi:hypothetical protein DYI25_05745 [Mesobacillus boroniphilus]|uniref:Uncharacterized protein n=1 Tax=Mesobacillus boroniphilus TaxID=308892 RepID=A0A944CIW2_9BACI|nr:hypothetical protein [Mesobacillus boroniphilus]MBS8263936.1 hypothetical protein [Mesobacillus boroniphilus]
MQKIKLFLSYQCYPIWIYDDKGELLNNDLVNELEKEVYIVNELNSIQTIYDSLFVDDGKTLEYIGFSSDVDRTSFQEKINKINHLIQITLHGKYIIEDEIEF